MYTCVYVLGYANVAPQTSDVFVCVCVYVYMYVLERPSVHSNATLHEICGMDVCMYSNMRMRHRKLQMCLCVCVCMYVRMYVLEHANVKLQSFLMYLSVYVCRYAL